MTVKPQQAMRALYYETIVMLSGTPCGNTLADIFGIINPLLKEPWKGLQGMQRIFGDPYDRTNDTLPKPQFDKLAKYLMSFSLGRPGKILKLKGHERIYRPFFLTKKEAYTVLKCTAEFVEMRNKAETACLEGKKPRDNDENSLGGTLKFATLARLHAAHPETARTSLLDGSGVKDREKSTDELGKHGIGCLIPSLLTREQHGRTVL
jgi:hypothetical protein